MKRKLVLASLVFVFVALFGWIWHLNAWRPRRVTAIPPDTVPLELQPNLKFRGAGEPIPASDLSVCEVASHHCQLLQGATNQSFVCNRFDYWDGENRAWNFAATNFSRDRSQVSVFDGSQICIWDARNGRLISRARLALIPQKMDVAAISLDGALAAVMVADPSSTPFTEFPTTYIEIFDVKSGNFLRRISRDAVFHLLFSASGAVLSVISESQTPQSSQSQTQLEFFDAQSGRSLWELELINNGEPAFLPNSESVICPNAKGLEIRDARTGKIERQIVGPSDILQIAVAPDGSQVWTSHQSGEIWWWRLK